MMTSTVIREKFFEFFRSKGHIIVPSAPIVVKNDPSLMFTNAGMNQFKDYFLGNKKSPDPRVADTQKCLRVSGKHNDLEEVGVDTYHHTMFEMLGNWSFGDYFKKEAIAWSWELLTGIYQIPKERLYVTVFEGDENERLPKDIEAINEWKKWLPEDRILLFGKKDNFWEMGDTGPCGPCTEIHVDCRNENERKTNGKDLVNRDHPQVIEIWNNVFIHFNRLKDGSLEELPSRHVDTGMGLERLVRVLQEKNSNYDTDIFTGTITEIEKITKKKYTADEGKEAISFRVIADHVRAISFTIADGQLPSNTGAGYVIRRILRRAARYYYSYLGYKQPLLYQLVDTLAGQFKDVFPELEKQKQFVSKVIKEEEHNFLKTLEAGLQKFEQITTSTSAKNSSSKTSTGLKTIEGEVAFELYDTYGFPFDLTKLIATEKNLIVDEAGFEAAMQKQKNRSRAASTMDTEDWIVLDDFALNSFVGYDSMEIKTKVVKYRKIKIKGKDAFQIVLEVTPFYAESGGQVGDTGWLEFDSDTIEVTDTKKENDLSIHFTDRLPTTLDGAVIARVNFTRRTEICIHHTATHLMHAALRHVLGKHVTQKGSLVNDEHLRFDFSHFSKMTDEEISKVETLVNERIRENIPVVIKEMQKDEALALGAMALFGEKYGDLVRVVIIHPGYSIELCGGTHVGSTGELGFFAINHETAVAAGVRRIEAVCGKMAEEFIKSQIGLLRGIRETLKNPIDLLKAIDTIRTENEGLKKQLEKVENRNLSELKITLVNKVENINGFNFIGEIVDVSNPDALKKICFDLKSEIRNYAVVLAANIDRKAHVAILLDEKLATEKNLDASKIIKEHVASIIKGGGGGQKTLATAGGQDPSNLPQVIEKVRSLLS